MIAGMIRDFLTDNRGKKTFSEYEVKGLLKEMGLPVPAGFLVTGTTDDSFLWSLPYPQVAKVSSSKITSKSELHGVRIGIKDRDELKKAIGELLPIPDAEGVLVEEMAPQGVDVIIGGIIDRQFGPVVMFGPGGIFVELFRDVAFALAPLSKDDALWLISQVKGSRLLEGYRGRPPVDKDALLDIIVAVSEIIATGLIAEIDLNPVALYSDGAMVLDAKMSAADSCGKINQQQP